MAVQVDEVAGLLPAEETAFAAQGLEHVAVADVRGDDAYAALLEQAVKSEVGHDRHGHELDAEVEREHGQDLVAVHHLAALVDGEHSIAVPVERDPEIQPFLDDELLQ